MITAGILNNLLTSFGYLAVFGLVGIESLGIPLPGETMLITAGIYAGAALVLLLTRVATTPPSEPPAYLAASELHGVLTAATAVVASSAPLALSRESAPVLAAPDSFVVTPPTGARMVTVVRLFALTSVVRSE